MEAPEPGYEDGPTPQKQSAGTATTRRDSEQEKDRGGAIIRTLRAEADREQGTADRVADHNDKTALISRTVPVGPWKTRARAREASR